MELEPRALPAGRLSGPSGGGRGCTPPGTRPGGGGQGARWALVETSDMAAVSLRPTEADAVPAGAAVGARAFRVRGLAVLVRVSHAHTPRTRACTRVPRSAGHPRSAGSQSPGSELRALLRSLNPQFVLPNENPAFGGFSGGQPDPSSGCSFVVRGHRPAEARARSRRMKARNSAAVRAPQRRGCAFSPVGTARPWVPPLLWPAEPRPEHSAFNVPGVQVGEQRVRGPPVSWALDSDLGVPL